MSYNFASIVDAPSSAFSVFTPQIDENASLVPEPYDGPGVFFSATGLYVDRDGSEVLKLVDHDISAWITSSRLVVSCGQYDNGGGWVGSPALMVAANLASGALARRRTRGSALVGQLWHPWCTGVGYAAKRNWRTINRLRVTATDGDKSKISIRLVLQNGADAHGLAQHLLDRVFENRLQVHPGVTPAQAFLEARVLAVQSPRAPLNDEVFNALHRGSYLVSAGSAYPNLLKDLDPVADRQP